MIQIFCGYTGLFNFVACLSLAIFLYLKNPKGLINRLFAAWSISVAFWSLGYFLWLFTERVDNALFWTRVLMAGAIMIPTVFLHFAIVFMGTQKQHRNWIFLFYLFSLVYLILDCTPLFIEKVEPRYWFRWWPVPGVTYHVYQVYFISAVIYSHILIFYKAWKSTEPIEQKQYLFVGIGTLIAYAGGSTNFFLWYNIPIPPVFNLLVSGYVAFMAYAIVRYQVMDIKVAITRSTLFALLYLFIIGIPAILVIWGRGFLIDQFGRFWWTLPLGIYTVLATMGPFIFTFFQKRVEQTLLADQQAYQQTLLQASRGMTLIKDLDKLLKLIVHILTKTVKITHAQIFLLEQDTVKYERKANRGGTVSTETPREFSADSSLVQHLKKRGRPLVLEEVKFQQLSARSQPLAEIQSYMKKLDARVIVPSLVRDRLIGFVVLGAKKSGQIYTDSDLDTLATLANQAALAVENCYFLKEFETQQAQLFQAAKMADLGTMASGIGHQINNRMNIIRMGADKSLMIDLKKVKEVIDRNAQPEEVKYFERLESTLRKISANAAHGGEIVGRLLDFSRLSEGYQALDIGEAVDSCVRLWECKHNLGEVNFDKEIAPGLPEIRGNYSQIEEVLFNLLDNAFDAVKMKEEAFEMGTLEKPAAYTKGSVCIRVGKFQRNGNQFVEITVSDDGIGMDETAQRQIFVPFFTTKATAIKGTGLGLYVIKRMVDAHKGEITLHSAPGKGTTFRLLLPA